MFDVVPSDAGEVDLGDVGAAAVALPGLIDARTETEPASFAGEAKRAMSPISAAMVYASTQAML